MRNLLLMTTYGTRSFAATAEAGEAAAAKERGQRLTGGLRGVLT